MAGARFVGLALCLAGGAALSVAMGQDANWDLLNYHFYNGFALLHGRFARDLLPTGLQSYLNPTLDAVYSGLALGLLRHAPRVLAAVTGLWYGLAVYLSARLATLLYPSRIMALLATAIAVTGAATIAQVGTPTEEVQVAAIMLAGLLIMLRGPAWRQVGGGGVLFGLAAGLKLTAVAYAPGALLATLSLQRGPGLPRRQLAAGALFATGWIGGFAVADGWWALMLARRFASPTFPMFNAAFRSPLYPPANLIDARFFPHDLAQWLFYPLYWAVHPTALVSEMPLRDPRLAVALLLALIGLLKPPRESPARALLVFLGAGYITWLASSSILRYAVVLEAVAGLLTPLLLARVVAPLIGARWQKVLAAAVAVAILVTTRYPATLRVPYGAETLQAAMGDIPADTLLVLTFRAPVSYLAALLPRQDSLQVVNVGDTVLEARGWGLHDRIVRMIHDHTGPIRVLTAGDPRNQFPELGEVGLSAKLEDCRPIESNFVAAGAAIAQLCPGQKVEPRRLASPFWAQAARRYRALVEIDDGSQKLNGAAYLEAAGPAARGTRFYDWTDLLWSGVGSSHNTLPDRLDPAALYILPPTMALAAASRIDPARDLLAQIDGLIAVAPGWRDCADCIAPAALELARYVTPLHVGGTLVLGAQARASGVLTSGWWGQEPAGLWSKGRAEMLLPLAADLPETSVLVLDGHLFTPAGGPTAGPGAPRVRIALADHPESQVEQSGLLQEAPGAIELPLRREWLGSQANGVYFAHIRLTFPDATSPKAVGMSGDERVLGFWPTDIRLLAAP